MGNFNVRKIEDSERAQFISHLLKDIRAVELMIERGLIERGITRIGAEQEFCLVKPDFSPSTLALDILKDINDPHFTTELARYNLEVNLDPIELKADCFQQVKHQLTSMLEKARKAAGAYDNKVVLAGILPTIRKQELTLEYLTPMDRYHLLNEITVNLRGGDFSIHMQGVDELTVLHDSILFEGCNTSFQMHLQVDPEDMVSSYNWSQAIAGPLLSVCANSPLLLGRELWSETRIALYQQSVDTRKASYSLTDQSPRVTFGSKWVRDSIVNIFKDDIAYHRTILTTDNLTDSLQELHDGRIPHLKALQINNGTIYRWNRPCIGVANDVAHLRIENRYIPSGPSVEDEIANFVFWVGLMLGRPEQFDQIETQMDFEDAKGNFYKAARHGKESQLRWTGNTLSAMDLVRKVLLPIAYDGLKKLKIDNADIERYLQIIELRSNRNTGASWTIKSFRNLKKELKRDDALKALTDEMYANQLTLKPVHEWSHVMHAPAHYPDYINKKVHEIMTTKIFTVHPNDLASLVKSIMDWRNIHHVPVVDSEENLTGIITSKNIITYENIGFPELTEVKDIMVNEVLTANPKMLVDEAADLMLAKKIGCLPVVENGKLIGIITRNDIVTRLK
ncbi:MAG TPA: CBS domain-containing protein [Cyclobacteriaceae bacterium]